MRSEPARSTTTSLLFLTIGGLKDVTNGEALPFSAGKFSRSFLPLLDLLT